MARSANANRIGMQNHGGAADRERFRCKCPPILDASTSGRGQLIASLTIKFCFRHSFQVAPPANCATLAGRQISSDCASKYQIFRLLTHNFLPAYVRPVCFV